MPKLCKYQFLFYCQLHNVLQGHFCILKLKSVGYNNLLWPHIQTEIVRQDGYIELEIALTDSFSSRKRKKKNQFRLLIFNEF